ncbi:MAG: hypothetical protein ACK5PQ_02665 [Alphaproteobacteria bacterium]
MTYAAIKNYVYRTFPVFSNKIRSFKYRVEIEIKTLYRVGIFKIIRSFLGSKSTWKNDLPLQSVTMVPVKVQSLAALLEGSPHVKEGGHTFYFSPSFIKTSPLKELMKYYPPHVGIKIIKNEGGIEHKYVGSQRGCRSYSIFSPSHKELLLSHNLFYVLNIGPRLYDLLEIKFQSGATHVAYIVEHVEGVTPSIQRAKKFLDHIKELEKKSVIKLINWNGYNDMDFKVPGCNGNLIFDTSSKNLKYVDLQNFGLGDNYPSILEKVSQDSIKATHFGDKSYLLGKEYLYQEIPGLNSAGKRATQKRLDSLKSLLGKASCSLESKLILDVGCNIGIMSALCLKEKAFWIHGFDLPKVITKTEKILLTIGCTRFSLSGLHLAPNAPLSSLLPSFLKNKLEGCVVLYLSIRGHIGWLNELATIPWEFMVYEGHENENQDMSLDYIKQLQKLKNCKIVAQDWIKDGNSQARYIAIIKAIREK